MSKPVPEGRDGDLDLPKALVKRLVKGKLAASDDGRDVQLNKDALLALSESAKVFITYLSSTANEVCKETKRSTISAEDVFQALEEIEFHEFVAPLRELLEAYRRESREKKGRKVEQQSRKRKERLSGTGGGAARPASAAAAADVDMDAAHGADAAQGDDAFDEGSDDEGAGEDGAAMDEAFRSAAGGAMGGLDGTHAGQAHEPRDPMATA